MAGRIRSVMRKEFRQISRDRRTLILLLIIPAFLLIMYGYALNFDIRHVSLAVLDQDGSRLSRDFYQTFLRSEYFDLKFIVGREKEIDGLLDRGRVKVVLVLPPDFSRNLLAGREAAVQVLVDGTEASAASTILGYVNAIVSSYSQNIIIREMNRSSRLRYIPPIDYRPRVWYNPELRSSRFLVPGLMAFILMIIVVISTSFSVVKEKERGTMEQILVSPIRPPELLIGKTIPYVLISLVSSHLVLFFSWLLFGVIITGSYWLLLVSMLLFLLGGLGLGLLVSTIAHTQQAAFMVSIILTMLPTFLLSGFVFPLRNTPRWIQVISYTIPARYFLVILRGIMLKGVGLEALWGQFFCLLAFSLITLFLSSQRMKRIRS